VREGGVGCVVGSEAAAAVVASEDGREGEVHGEGGVEAVADGETTAGAHEGETLAVAHTHQSCLFNE
jgi:hypothetical protein